MLKTVPLIGEAHEIAGILDIKILTIDIIYHLFDHFNIFLKICARHTLGISVVEVAFSLTSGLQILLAQTR